jgi:hypothetical protein
MARTVAYCTILAWIAFTLAIVHVFAPAQWAALVAALAPHVGR